MSEKKDYLSQLSSEVEKKPESFKEESFQRVEKQKININPKIVGIVVLIIALLIGLFIFFTATPKIVMPDFVNKPVSDVNNWIKQEEIDPSRMVMLEEFSMTVDKGSIISQSVEAGDKVSIDEKHTFVSSLGADPDEAIEFVDIQNMTKDEILEWIETNKLLKTKISSSYSEEIAEDSVISFDLKKVEPEDFKRGTALTINISKGNAPAGVVVLEDFVKKPLMVAEDFAKNKKIELNIIEVYDDKVEEGIIISQSIESGKSMKEGEVLTVTTSLGKAVKVIDFSGYDKLDLEAWVTLNPTANMKIEEIYSNETGYVLSQSMKAGTIMAKEDKLIITVNLGKPRLDKDYVGADFRELFDWCKNISAKGTDMQAGDWGNESIYSSTYRKNQIMSITCSSNSTGKVYSCAGDLEVDTRFTVLLSKGLRIDLPASAATPAEGPMFGDETPSNNADADSITTWLSGLKFQYSIETVTDQKDVGLYVGVDENRPERKTSGELKENDKIVVKKL